MKISLTLFFTFLVSFFSVAEEKVFLPVEQAFPLEWKVTKTGVQLSFDTQEGYYLYKDKFRTSVSDGVVLQPVRFSNEGKIKNDPNFGQVTVIHQPVTLSFDYAGKGDLTVRYQGCADKGLCYLPQKSTFSLPLMQQLSSSGASSSRASLLTEVTTLSASTEGLSNYLSSVSKLQALLLFFVLGLGLSLTPCVLPMVPILSSIIGGERKMDGKKGFALSLSYVLGMASSYALSGILVTTIAKGVNLQAAMQQPWLLSIFASVFVLLAMSMFGLYELQLPSFIQEKLNNKSDKLGGGKVASVFAMGAISALVVSPCVSAPLAGALLYVSTTQDWVFGGVTLFVMALGMGAPLILLGISGGKLLPKSGAWMIKVKQFFGVLLLSVAIVLLSRFLSDMITLLLWAILAIGVGIHFGALEQANPGWPRTRKMLAFMSMFYGVILFVGALMGGHDPLQPLANASTVPSSASMVKFNHVSSIRDLDAQLALAKKNQQKVLVDLYADWCVSCKEIEKELFTQSDIQDGLKDWVKIKLDVTESTPEQMKWLANKNIFGPPALMFYMGEGVEAEEKRVVGTISAKTFLDRVLTF